MSTSETRAVLVGIVVVALVGLAALARWYRNRRLNARDDEAAARTQTAVLPEWRDGLPDQTGGSASPGETGRPDSGVLQVPDVPALASGESEAQLDEEWADQLAAMNAEHLNVAEHLERVHARPWWGLECDCETFEDHERAEWDRITRDEAAWLNLAQDHERAVSRWLGWNGAGWLVHREGNLPSAAGWPSDDWRGEMIPA